MQLRAFFSEMDDRKCVVLSVVGVDGAPAMCAILGRRCWYCCRMWEVVLTEGVKRLQSDWWTMEGETVFSVVGGRGHCNGKVWGCTSSWAEKPKAAGGKPKLTYDDCRGWY